VRACARECALTRGCEQMHPTSSNDPRAAARRDEGQKRWHTYAAGTPSCERKNTVGNGLPSERVRCTDVRPLLGLDQKDGEREAARVDAKSTSRQAHSKPKKLASHAKESQDVPVNFP
jgi:hypothetical protein